MQNIKIVVCSFFVIFLLNGCSLNMPQISKEELQKTVEKVQSSKIIVLDVYHNRCESCKSIEPVIEKLKTNYSNNSDVSFLKYDLSNPLTTMQSRKIAKALGLKKIYKEQRYSGVVLIIDTMSKKVLDTLIAEYNIEKYNEVISKRLGD